VIPIDAGERVTGKVGPFSVGALDIETGEDTASKTPATNFAAVRLKRDILRRSNIGVMATNRSKSAVVPGASNFAYGADASFSFFENLAFGGYYARSDTAGRRVDNDSYEGRFGYTPDRYGIQLDYLKVGRNFNPEVGFVRRFDFTRSSASLRFSPRPKHHFTGIRQFSYQADLEYYENGAGQVESRVQSAKFAAERQNSDVFSVSASSDYELLTDAFPVAPSITIPAGGYRFSEATIAYQLGQQRRLSGTASFQRGQFYDGTITAYGYSTGRLAILKQWSVEPSVSINAVSLPEGDFTRQVIRARSDYAFSPRRFISALVQYSSSDHVLSSNFRFRWEYHPGSELFVVYTDERDTLTAGYPGLKNRAVVVKLNRLWQF
jgi:hypothetical protein